MIKTSKYLLGAVLLPPVIALSTQLGAANTPPTELEPEHHTSITNASPSSLVAQVREATAAFRDVNLAVGYEPFGGCVSGPDEGAMGVHFVNPAFLLDGELNVKEPEALIYEFKDGRARLVGVEYIVLAAQWDAAHKEPPAPPVLEGQFFHFIDSPNRFRLDPFYELHVWAWRDNPNGAFVDWNPRVTCEGQ